MSRAGGEGCESKWGAYSSPFEPDCLYNMQPKTETTYTLVHTQKKWIAGNVTYMSHHTHPLHSFMIHATVRHIGHIGFIPTFSHDLGYFSRQKCMHAFLIETIRKTCQQITLVCRVRRICSALLCFSCRTVLFGGWDLYNTILFFFGAEYRTDKYMIY